MILYNLRQILKSKIVYQVGKQCNATHRNNTLIGFLISLYKFIDAPDNRKRLIECKVVGAATERELIIRQNQLASKSRIGK